MELETSTPKQKEMEKKNGDKEEDKFIESKEQEEDKENHVGRNREKRPSYLMFEDFSHEGEGLETYADGLSHPVELRRILTGDLATEMTVGYKEENEEFFRYSQIWVRAIETIHFRVHSESPLIQFHKT